MLNVYHLSRSQKGTGTKLKRNYVERAEIVRQHTKVKAEKMSLFALDFAPETLNPSLSFARHQYLVRLGLIKLKIKAPPPHTSNRPLI